MSSSQTSTVLNKLNPVSGGKKLVLTSKHDSSSKVQTAGNILGKFKSLEETARVQGKKVTRSAWVDRFAGESVTSKTGRTAPVIFKDIVQEKTASDYQESQRRLAEPVPVHPARSMGIVYGNQPVPINQSNYSTFASHERASDTVHGRHEFEEGIIFSSVSHEHDGNQDINQPNRNQSATGFGVVYSKYRKFIVLARFATHVLALPIYTHEGRGLSYKNHRNEFVSIRDVHLKSTAGAAESSHNILWAKTHTPFKSTTWHMMTNKTAVHFTKTYSHKYQTKCTITGELELSSLVYLKQLFADVVATAVHADKLATDLSRDFNRLDTNISTASTRLKTYNESIPVPFLARGNLNEEGWRTVGSVTSRR